MPGSRVADEAGKQARRSNQVYRPHQRFVRFRITPVGERLSWSTEGVRAALRSLGAKTVLRPVGHKAAARAPHSLAHWLNPCTAEPRIGHPGTLVHLPQWILAHRLCGRARVACKFLS